MNRAPHLPSARGAAALTDLLVTGEFTGCTRLTHLAGAASVERSREDPIGPRRINDGSTVGPLGELSEVASGTPYAVDRLLGEGALAAHQCDRGLQGVARCFFEACVHRLRSDSPSTGVNSQLVHRGPAADPISVFGDGGRVRAFVVAGDAARVRAYACTGDGDAGDLQSRPILRGPCGAGRTR